MPTKAGARIKRRETIGLRLGRIDDLPYIDTHAIAKHRKLVHKTNVHVTISVLKDLLHLRHSRRGDARHTTFEHCLIDRSDAFQGIVADGADHLRGVLVL